MNQNRMTQVDMMNNQNQMAMASMVQKIGKGKRKYDVKVQKHNLKFLANICKMMQKQMAAYAENPQTKGVITFLAYVEKECLNKNLNIKMSFEELEFLKKSLVGSVSELENVKYKWHQIFKKIFTKVWLKQYKVLVEDFKK